MRENYLEALKWYGKAADMGNAEAKYKIGKILWEEGKRYLQESWEQGNADAGAFIKENLKGIEENNDCEYLVFKSPKPFSIYAEKRWDGIIEYSLDKVNWHEWSGESITSDTIYMRGCGNSVITNGRRWRFETNDRLICRGNIETLLDYKLCVSGEHPLMKEGCYRSMFKGCTSLSEAPSLPATALAGSCYESMFEGCTSLSEAPSLPATALAGSCYESMFEGCTSLSEAPSLPATALAASCYQSMFGGCTSLKEAPSLPATKSAVFCYMLMFRGCTSLKEAPSLPATELVDFCYSSMFEGCTSLKEAPSLPATELVAYCYRSMFEGCTSLKEAPSLPTRNLAAFCYTSMFKGCNSLKGKPNLPRDCFL